jgi:hypothetical protein
MTALDGEDSTRGDVDGITCFLPPPGDNYLMRGLSAGGRRTASTSPHFRYSLQHRFIPGLI